MTIVRPNYSELALARTHLTTFINRMQHVQVSQAVPIITISINNLLCRAPTTRDSVRPRSKRTAKWWHKFSLVLVRSIAINPVRETRRFNISSATAHRCEMAELRGLKKLSVVYTPVLIPLNIHNRRRDKKSIETSEIALQLSRLEFCRLRLAIKA